MNQKSDWMRILLKTVSYILVAALSSALTLFLCMGGSTKLTELETVIKHQFIGEADMEDRATPEIRQAGYDHMLDLGEYHSGPDAPELTFFTTKHAEAWICDIDGSKTRIEL